MKKRGNQPTAGVTLLKRNTRTNERTSLTVYLDRVRVFTPPFYDITRNAVWLVFNLKFEQ